MNKKLLRSLMVLILAWGQGLNTLTINGPKRSGGLFGQGAKPSSEALTSVLPQPSATQPSSTSHKSQSQTPSLPPVPLRRPSSSAQPPSPRPGSSTLPAVSTRPTSAKKPQPPTINDLRKTLNETQDLANAKQQELDDFFAKNNFSPDRQQALRQIYNTSMEITSLQRLAPKPTPSALMSNNINRAQKSLNTLYNALLPAQYPENETVEQALQRWQQADGLAKQANAIFAAQEKLQDKIKKLQDQLPDDEMNPLQSALKKDPNHDRFTAEELAALIAYEKNNNNNNKV